jgi:hypothetical protein
VGPRAGALREEADKHLPAEWLCKDAAYQRGLLDGLVASDGFIRAGRTCFRNTSNQLVELFGLLCLLVHGSLPNVEGVAPSAGGLPGVVDEDCEPSYRARLNCSHAERHVAEYAAVKVLETVSPGCACRCTTSRSTTTATASSPTTSSSTTASARPVSSPASVSRR